MLINAQQMLSNAQQCSAMLSNAQQCSAMLSNEFQRDSKRTVMLIMLNVFFKKLMSSPPSPPHPPVPPPNQRIRGAPRSLGGAPKKPIDLAVENWNVVTFSNSCSRSQKKMCNASSKANLNS